ncbi:MULTISPECIES: TolC family protein [Petrimonas]|jgi:outer membrane protein|uniref:Proteases secretion protein PrtF n=2 Tax=Petrimonas mucosa TaxID=1642646 RepID=A0A1G4G4Y4_9BACT|nr:MULTISPECIES: TolC family protein [Petrimonas]MDD3560958.1 TolC family protein [Petrimonas mucosa]SCM56205.1 Proteases secretion protein PrtF [Petrimonas mucosa]SFU57718.1 outer membrane protein [Porphyromonadaceae bacterium KHP3R9]HHT29006.1 TolC family protein [Petrimonas mucosa]
MRTFIFIAVFCSLTAWSRAQQYTLEECIEIALQNNRNIKQQELGRAQRQIAYSQARNDLLPSLNASAGQSFVFGRSIGIDNTYQNTNSSQTSFGIGADITLFDGLRMKYNIDAKRADLLAAEADLERFRDEIEMSVATAFLQVLLQKELLQIADEQIQLTDSNINRRKELIRNGKMAQGEIYELEAQRAREEQNRVQAESSLKLALLDLAQIMELEDFSTFDLSAPSVESIINESVLLSTSEIFQSALLTRPEIKAAQYRLESSEKEVLMARSQLYPSLSFGANIGTGYYNMSGRSNDPFSSQIRNNMSNSVGFSLRIPIFNKFQIKNSIRSAELAMANNRLEIDKAKIELRKRIEQAYHNALGAESKWKATQKSETAEREAFRFAQEKFNNGRANAYELFQAKSNLTQTLSDQAQAKYEYAFRLKILELLKK